MHDYEVISEDRPESRVRVRAPDSGDMLLLAGRLGCARALVMRDGEYLFSLCRLGRGNGYWVIFHRPPEPVYTAFG